MTTVACFGQPTHFLKSTDKERAEKHKERSGLAPKILVVVLANFHEKKMLRFY